MARYARTNHANGGFKDNTPGGWVDTNGPVWWYGDDKAWLGNSAGVGFSAVSRATNLIVNRISASPWRIAPDPDSARWIDDPMVLRSRANDRGLLPAAQRVGKSVFWGTWIRHALVYGMGYLAFQPNNDGTPVAGTLRLLDPRTVDPDPDAWYGGGSQKRRIQTASGYLETDEEGLFDGGRYRLVELRNPTTPLDTSTGVTPGTLAYHAVELGLIGTQVTYAEGMYGGGGVPSGYLKVNTPDFTQEQADSLLGVWKAAHGSGQRNTAVLNASTEYQAIAVSPVDAAIADMKKLSYQDVANAFGVPGYMIGAPGTSMTYSNVEMEKEAFYEFTLMPWAVAVEEALTALLPGSQRLNIAPSGEVSSGGLREGDTRPGADVP